MTAPMTAEEACKILDVSRETKARFEAYVATLTEWQNRMNLVSRASLEDVWRRHILDCGQVARHFPESTAPILDMGSGAGLPGLILAAMLAETGNPPQVLLVESSRRKCDFLHAAAGAMGIAPQILNTRMEDLPPLDPLPHIITARAVAPLAKLLRFTRRQWHGGLTCFFFKGASHKDELTALDDFPYIKTAVIPSVSNPDSAILRLANLTS